jgi:hypothetical protein
VKPDQEQKMSFIRTTLLAIVGAIAVSAASATTISVVDPTTFVGPAGPTIADARYRLSNTGVDQLIAPGGNPISGFGAAGIGNVAALTGRTFDFELTYTSGTGTRFRLFDANTNSTVRFTTADGTRNGVKADGPFNTILLSAFSNQTGASMTVSDIVFTWGAGLTGPSSVANLTRSGTQGAAETWLATTANLADFDFTIAGKVTGVKVLTGGDESVKFDIGLKNRTLPAPIPLPAAGWMLVAGLATLGVAARMRKIGKTLPAPSASA